jgi:thymidine kinase
MMLFDRVTAHLIVIVSVQTQMVVDVGRSDDDRQRSTLNIDEQAFFDPRLARSVEVGLI